MPYFFIRNKGTLDRRLIEIAGLSTKRDASGRKQPDKRGYRGSGKKLSAVAALRAGITTGISSDDVRGRYFLDFVTETLNVGQTTAERLQLAYHDDEARRTVVDTSWCTDAFADWGKPVGDDDQPLFKILREHVIDAFDEDRQFVWGTCATRTFADDGETLVLLDDRQDWHAMLAAAPRYFKFLSDDAPLAAVDGIGEAWPKSQDTHTRLFVRGVLASCTKDAWESSLFDYSLDDDGLLSEDRTLRGVWGFRKGLGELFAAFGPEHLNVCRAIMQGVEVGEAGFESAALGGIDRLSGAAKAVWLRAAHDVFGPKPALRSANEVVNSDARQMYGHRIVDVDGQARRFLKLLGVPEADAIFPKADEQIERLRFDDVRPECQKRLLRQYSLFAALRPDRARYPLRFFRATGPKTDAFAAFSGSGDAVFEEVWFKVAADGSLPDDDELLAILEHETRHCVTRTFDHERPFVRQADADIVAYARRLEKLIAVPEAQPDFGDEDVWFDIQVVPDEPEK